MSTQPRVFIGSSVEGLPIAEAVQVGLDHAAEVTIWHQGVFGLSKGTLEELARKAKDFDFAVLVLTPDDMTSRRGVSGNSPRDNVIFELGLFMGALGRERTFMMCPRDSSMELPSDLAGVVPTTYRTRTDNNLRAAVGPACTDIKDAIRAYGRQSAAAVNTDGVSRYRGEAAVDVSPPDEVEESEERAPPPQRLLDAMLGDDETGLTAQEVAELSGYAIGTVRSYISGGRRKVLGEAIRADAQVREKALSIVARRREKLDDNAAERGATEQIQRLRDEMLGDSERGLSVEETARLSGYAVNTVRSYLASGRRYVLGDAIRADDKSRARALAIVSKRRRT